MLVDNQPEKSCDMDVTSAVGKRITTTEVADIPLYYPPFANAYSKGITGLRMTPALQWTLEGAERSAQLQRAAGPVAVPERHLAGLAGGGGDHDPFEGDVVGDSRCTCPRRGRRTGDGWGAGP